MMFSSNAFRSVFVLAAACNAMTMTSATDPVYLGDAEDYVILAKTGISTVPSSVVKGSIGVSPIAAEAMTGFSLILDGSGDFATSAQLYDVNGTEAIEGKAYAPDYDPAIASALTTAVGFMETAYTDAAGRTNSDAARINLGGGTLGGAFGGFTTQLTPGVYTFGTGVDIAETIYFDGENNSTSVFIIQMTGNLLQAANTKVILTNGTLAKNIFWQISGNVEVGAGAEMQGILLVKTDILFKTGSKLTGRVLSQTACNLQMALIDSPPAV
jgi:hypothetical protein